jgi:hypothetical protein
VLPSIPPRQEDHPVLDGALSPTKPDGEGLEAPRTQGRGPRIMGDAYAVPLSIPGPGSSDGRDPYAPTTGRSTAGLPQSTNIRNAAGPPTRPGHGMAPMVPSPSYARGGATGESVAPGGRAASPYRSRRAPKHDDPWAAKEGVPSVLSPPEGPIVHDPGPGVIGIDR